MRWTLLIFLGCFALCGCEWLRNLSPTPDVTPVMGEPPPRMNVAADKTWRPRRNSSSKGSGIRQVSRSGKGDLNQQLIGTEIVATVNGTPILAADVLERYQAVFEQARSDGATPEQLRALRERAIKHDLEAHVERTLLAGALKASLPRKNLSKLDETMDSAFKQEIDRLKKVLQVDTKAQVEAKLQEMGTSLANRRDSFANEMMATHYFQEKTKKKKVLLGRPELLNYYNEHLADYRVPAKARWQEIQISYDAHGGRSPANDLLQKAVKELQQGADFDQVAKKYSDGVTARKGGHWDWTQSGSLTDRQIDQWLFNAPLNRIKPFAGDDAVRLIRVTERTPEHYTPFDKVQAEIERKLKAEARRKIARKVIDDLMRTAVITTIFDGDESYRPRWRTLQSDRLARTSGAPAVSR